MIYTFASLSKMSYDELVALLVTFEVTPPPARRHPGIAAFYDELRTALVTEARRRMKVVGVQRDV